MHLVTTKVDLMLRVWKSVEQLTLRDADIDVVLFLRTMKPSSRVHNKIILISALINQETDVILVGEGGLYVLQYCSRVRYLKPQHTGRILCI